MCDLSKNTPQRIQPRSHRVCIVCVCLSRSHDAHESTTVTLRDRAALESQRGHAMSARCADYNAHAPGQRQPIVLAKAGCTCARWARRGGGWLAAALSRSIGAPWLLVLVLRASRIHDFMKSTCRRRGALAPLLAAHQRRKRLFSFSSLSSSSSKTTMASLPAACSNCMCAESAA